jgi:hypothetical protein
VIPGFVDLKDELDQPPDEGLAFAVAAEGEVQVNLVLFAQRPVGQQAVGLAGPGLVFAHE